MNVEKFTSFLGKITAYDCREIGGVHFWEPSEPLGQESVYQKCSKCGKEKMLTAIPGQSYFSGKQRMKNLGIIS